MGLLLKFKANEGKWDTLKHYEKIEDILMKLLGRGWGGIRNVRYNELFLLL